MRKAHRAALDSASTRDCAADASTHELGAADRSRETRRDRRGARSRRRSGRSTMAIAALDGTREIEEQKERTRWER